MIGQCSYPHDKPFIPKCEGCVRRLKSDHTLHTFKHGECRFGEASATGRPPPQSRPHEPRRRHDAEPTAHQRGSSSAGELGAESEEAVVEQDRLEALRAAKTKEMERKQAEEQLTL